MRHNTTYRVLAVGAAILAVLTGCGDVVPDGSDTSVHPKNVHPILPVSGEGTQIASGVIEDEALEQPIAFTHYRHVSVVGIECQYCHPDTRRSKNAGLPSVEACMGCHTHIKKESSEIQKLASYWEKQEPVPWKRVHDLPDYVHFAHERHVRAGVNCTECHGQVGLQGQWPDGTPEGAQVMKRESSLQMGWCLDCHASHPSIDENYGDMSDLRRTELKDCWTCHK